MSGSPRFFTTRNGRESTPLSRSAAVVDRKSTSRATLGTDRRPIAAAVAQLAQLANAPAESTETGPIEEVKLTLSSGETTAAPAKNQAGAPIQRKLEFEHDGTKITKCKFTRRPGFTSAVKKAMPSAAGYDRGHKDPWMAIKLEIEMNLVGMTAKQADAWLSTKGQAVGGSGSWADIEAAIREYAREANSDLDNLDYEPSSENRSNGAKLPMAAELWKYINGKPSSITGLPVQVTDTDGAKLTLSTNAEAEEWCRKVGISSNATAAEADDIADKYKQGGCTVM